MSDATEFHDFEQAQWERTVGPYHDGWSRLTGRAIAPMLDAVRCEAGTRLLDVACGPGGLAGAAAVRGAAALGVDIAGAMVATARRLHQDVAFETGDAEALDFTDRTFDAVAMGFGILHLARPDAAIAEAFRVLRPGGRYAFTAWRGPEGAIGFQTVLDAIQAHGRPVSLPEGPRFFRFGDPANCRAELERAGFAGVDVRALDLVWELASADDLFEAFHVGTARTGALLRDQDDAGRAAIAAAVTSALAPCAHPEGGLAVPMPALLASGERPA